MRGKVKRREGRTSVVGRADGAGRGIHRRRDDKRVLLALARVVRGARRGLLRWHHHDKVGRKRTRSECVGVRRREVKLVGAGHGRELGQSCDTGWVVRDGYLVDRGKLTVQIATALV